MRAILVALVMVFLGSTAAADDGRTRDNVDVRTLSATQIDRYAASYYPMIRACYVEHGQAAPQATGELTVKVIIHRGGHVHDMAIEAPGVYGKRLRRLENCIRLQVIGWHFPVRRDFTTAMLPYYFQRVHARGAGPVYSCWNRRGCTTTPPRRR